MMMMMKLKFNLIESFIGHNKNYMDMCLMLLLLLVFLVFQIKKKEKFHKWQPPPSSPPPPTTFKRLSSTRVSPLFLLLLLLHIHTRLEQKKKEIIGSLCLEIFIINGLLPISLHFFINDETYNHLLLGMIFFVHQYVCVCVYN